MIATCKTIVRLAHFLAYQETKIELLNTWMLEFVTHENKTTRGWGDAKMLLL